MRLVLMLCLVAIALLIAIIVILGLSGDQQQPVEKTGKRSSSAVERLDDHYYSLRTVINFPKSGLHIPADLSILTDDPAHAQKAIADAGTMGIGAPFISNDTLSVPEGTQCNLSLDATQFFLNAGSKLVAGPQNEAMTQVTLDGEAYVRTGPAKGCIVSFGSSYVRLLPGTCVHISAFDNERAIRVCLGAGTASVQQQEDIRVLRQSDDAVVIDKATGAMEPMRERFADVTAWTQGKLHGENQSFAYIYRQLSRLFDVPIVYKDTALLHGIYSIPYRDFTLKSILGTLEKAQHCHTLVARDSIFITPDSPL